MARSSKMILAQECLYSASLRSNEPFAEAISRPTTTADIREIMAIASLTTVVVSELKCSLGRTGPRNRPSKAPPKTHTNTIAPTVLEFTSCLGKSLRRTGRPRAPGGATTVKCPLCAIFVRGALRGRSMLRDTCANSQITANRPNDQSTAIATTIRGCQSCTSKQVFSDGNRARQAQGVRGVSGAVAQDRMGRLCEETIRRTRTGVALSIALYPPRRHRQQPARRAQRLSCRIQVERLPRRRTRTRQGDDARHRRVHPPLPHPRAAHRLPSHPPLRSLRQRLPRREHRPSAATARRATDVVR